MTEFRYTTLFVRSFVRSFIRRDVWSTADQRSRSLVRARGIIFRRIHVRARSLSRSVPLPGLRAVDYASLQTSRVLVTRDERY